jgi:GT2 family glycosyltransferase
MLRRLGLVNLKLRGDHMDFGARVDCAVVIVTYNSDSYIGGLLDCLEDSAPDLSMRVVVVDNGSTDTTTDIVAKHSDVICVRATRNRGYAAGINIGRSHAGDYSAILVLNPDVLLEAGSVTQMFNELQTPGIGVVVPMLTDRSGGTYSSLRREPTVMRALGDCFLGQRFGSRPGWSSETVWDPRVYEGACTVDWATGAVMMIASECDQQVGPWDERFFLYSEETDYAARVRRHGFKIKYLPTARAQHTGGGSGTSDELTALMAVNRIRYAEIWGRWPKLFRGTVVLHELLRSYRRGHRIALRILLQRSNWSDIILRLQGSDTEVSPEAVRREQQSTLR